MWSMKSKNDNGLASSGELRTLELKARRDSKALHLKVRHYTKIKSLIQSKTNTQRTGLHYLVRTGRVVVFTFTDYRSFKNVKTNSIA